MSAEEVATAEAVAAPAATEDNTAAAPTTNGDTKKPPREREERKRDETPVEELYDLTQPIPRVRYLICVTFLRGSFCGSYKASHGIVCRIHPANKVRSLSITYLLTNLLFQFIND